MGSKAIRAGSLELIASASMLWAASSDAAIAQSRLFSCPHGRVVELTVKGPDAISADRDDGRPVTLKRDPANPLRFANGKFVVTLTPDQGALTLEVPDGSTKCLFGSQNVQPFLPKGGAATAAATSCGPGFHPVPETDRCDPNPGSPPSAQPRRTGTAEGKFPMGGQSLGGIMRSAPSMSSSKVMSLSEGAGIMLIERAGAMDGYDWFKINFRGTTGYQWGGIMCSQSPIRGIFQQCEP